MFGYRTFYFILLAILVSDRILGTEHTIALPVCLLGLTSFYFLYRTLSSTTSLYSSTTLYFSIDHWIWLLVDGWLEWSATDECDRRCFAPMAGLFSIAWRNPIFDQYRPDINPTSVVYTGVKAHFSSQTAKARLSCGLERHFYSYRYFQSTI